MAIDLTQNPPAFTIRKSDDTPVVHVMSDGTLVSGIPDKPNLKVALRAGLEDTSSSPLCLAFLRALGRNTNGQPR